MSPPGTLVPAAGRARRDQPAEGSPVWTSAPRTTSSLGPTSAALSHPARRSLSSPQKRRPFFARSAVALTLTFAPALSSFPLNSPGNPGPNGRTYRNNSFDLTPPRIPIVDNRARDRKRPISMHGRIFGDQGHRHTGADQLDTQH